MFTSRVCVTCAQVFKLCSHRGSELASELTFRMDIMNLDCSIQTVTLENEFQVHSQASTLTLGVNGPLRFIYTDRKAMSLLNFRKCTIRDRLD